MPFRHAMIFIRLMEMTDIMRIVRHLKLDIQLPLQRPVVVQHAPCMANFQCGDIKVIYGVEFSKLVYLGYFFHVTCTK